MAKKTAWSNKTLAIAGIVLVIFIVGVIAVSQPELFTPAGEFRMPTRPAPATWISVGNNIYTTGNVGIGTANPSEKLDVYGAISATGLRIKAANAQTVFQIDSAGRIWVPTGTSVMSSTNDALINPPCPGSWQLFVAPVDVQFDWIGTSVTRAVAIGGTTFNMTVITISGSAPPIASMIIDGKAYALSTGSTFLADGVPFSAKAVTVYGQGTTGRVALSTTPSYVWVCS